MRNSKNKIKYKTLEELEQMTEEEIENHRVNILTNSNDFHKDDCTDKRYVDELEFYTDVRFKGSKIAMQQRWKDDENQNVGVAKTMSHDMLYKVGLASSMPKDGEFIFITPMPEPEGVTIDGIRKFNRIFTKK